ncbi:membrane protein [Achromatium sp. WMS1]|nr:membrane protein [Achromatium sp. WMS1]
MQKLEYMFESLLFHSRWLLAPFYFGLVLGICILLFKFLKEFISLLSILGHAKGSDILIGVLTLVDVTLVANLLLIMIFAGYETFVSKIDIGNHKDRPSWMGKVGFTDLKIKLFGSIVAISGIELLNAFLKAESFTSEQLAWKVGIHLTFVISGLLFALTDRLGHNAYHSKSDNNH